MRYNIILHKESELLNLREWALALESKTIELLTINIPLRWIDSDDKAVFLLQICVKKHDV